MARLNDDEIKDIFVSNLLSIMKEKDIDGATLARMIGKEKQSVYAWLKKRSFPSTSSLQLLVNALGVTTDELLIKDEEPHSGFIETPLYGSIAAGTPIEMLDIEGTQPVPTKVHEKYPDSFLLKVEGESMNRVLPNGCFALVDPCKEIDRDNEPYAVCVNGYDATIKRVKQLANGFQLIPDSDDPTYTTKTFNYNEEGTEQITIIGRVVYYVLPFDWEF